MMTLALVISACGSSSMPALTEAEQTAVAGTVTAVFAAIESSAEPSVTPSPEPSATPLPEPTPTPVVPIGPNSYPEGVNPLTGLKVENPELLQRRPVIMKISNHQIDYQPQWGFLKLTSFLSIT